MEFLSKTPPPSGGGEGVSAEPFVIEVTIGKKGGTATTTVTAEELAEHYSNCVFAVNTEGSNFPATYFKPTIYAKGEYNGMNVTQVGFCGPIELSDDKYFYLKQVFIVAQDDTVNVQYIEKRYFTVPDYYNDGSKDGDYLKRVGTGIQFVTQE